MLRLVFVAGVAAFALAASGCDGSSSATPQPPLVGATAVSAGYSHTCALMNDATVRCWGGDAFGQLGDGETTFSVPAPLAVPGLAGVKSVVAGDSFTCVLKTDGTVECWGENTNCQLGNGCNLFSVSGSESDAIDDPNPVAVTGFAGPVTALALGGQSNGDEGYACAILAGATVTCWGSNELGIDPSPTVNVIPLTPVSGLTNVESLALGDSSACAVLADGTAACWGQGPLGQPGNADSYSATPLAVSGLSGVVAVAAGGFHACALLDTGTVACWGNNFGAQLGDGTTTDSATPVTVSGVSGAVAIAANDYTTCALSSDGTVKCWGGDTTMLTPVMVPGLKGALSISVAPHSACALVAGGEIKCWGDNSVGQLGDGLIVPADGGPYSTTPVTVVSGS